MPAPSWPAPGVLPRRPLSLGDVLVGTLRLYGRRFGQLVLVAVIPALVGLAGIVAAGVLVLVGGLRLVAGASAAVPRLDGSTLALLVGAWALLLGLSVVVALVQVKCQGMMALAAYDVEQRRASTVEDLWRRTHGLARRVLALALLGALAGTAVIIALAVLAISASMPDAGPLAAVLALVALALGPALLYLVVRWAFVLQALAIEGDGALACLGRSWRTSRGAFWRIVGYLFVVNVLVSLASGAVSGALRPILPHPDHWGDPDALLVALAQLAGVVPLLLAAGLSGLVLAVLTRPFLVLFMTVLYLDQRRRLGLGRPRFDGPGFPGPGRPGPYPGYPGYPGHSPSSSPRPEPYGNGYGNGSYGGGLYGGRGPYGP